MRLGRDLLSASSPKEPEPRQCLAPAQPPLAQNHLQNVDRSNPLQCRAPSPQSTPTRLLDLSASKILTSTIFPLKTDRKSTDRPPVEWMFRTQRVERERPEKFSQNNRISINCRTMEFAALRSRLEVLHSLRRPWFVAGGWAIDLFLGRETRNHQDIHIAIFREDQLELRRHLANWKWEKAVNGTLVCWESNEWLELPIHEVCARSGEHQLQFLCHERRKDLWLYQEDQSITRPIAHFRHQSGLPIFPPEITLLYKSQSPSERDLTDLRQVWPRLNSEARGWQAAPTIKIGRE